MKIPWHCRVSALLRHGYGTEDIAIKLGCDVEHVRLEVDILREQGRLAEIYDRPAYGRTATTLQSGGRHGSI